LKFTAKVHGYGLENEIISKHCMQPDARVKSSKRAPLVKEETFSFFQLAKIYLCFRRGVFFCSKTLLHTSSLQA
jgi:hypothetical protein